MSQRILTRQVIIYLGQRKWKYFTTVMNVGVTQDMQGKKTLVTDDLRNGNGRTIKSRYSAKNRVDREQAPLDSIFLDHER